MNFPTTLCLITSHFSVRCSTYPLLGVSLDIENYCTVSLFFEQAYL
ncbi:hypothetical protein BFV79_004784 [Salmonella enterica subsp. enterica serovar Putten]|nr:hypothetical protein [Salmonella enterica subsp. enterica serovar Putten]